MTERDDWLASLPKAELHLHLEGAIPLPALFELVQAAGGDPAVPTVEALRARLTYPDFPRLHRQLDLEERLSQDL